MWAVCSEITPEITAMITAMITAVITAMITPVITAMSRGKGPTWLLSCHGARAVIETSHLKHIGSSLEGQDVQASHKLGWMDELLEHKGVPRSCRVGFPCRTQHLAALQLPVQDNKAQTATLHRTSSVPSSQCGIADHTGITQLS